VKVATFSIEGRKTWGVIDGGNAMDIGAVLCDRAVDLKSAIAKGLLTGLDEHAHRPQRYALSAIAWEPVVPNPDKILCIGLNYETHRKETGRSVVAHPTIFARYSSSQIGHLADIIRPRLSNELDFEGELAVIIGKAGRYITPANALRHVAGYACYNDGSLRDFQRHSHQFTPGKNFPATGAFGPCMVTPDEVGDLNHLRLQTRVNGEVLQEAELGQMIFDVAHIISYCSSFTNLEPGDVIVTGTPGGVGAKRNPPFWLKPGDIVEVEIENIGLLRNGIADEKMQ
jgi:2-keto-4-pentenoate hydratase/2-oxohepta-3-ene-1,7-dioic acid hydratase in catechol pathway